MKQLKRTKRPVVLTMKGKAAAIVQDTKPISACSTLPPMPMQRKASVRAWRTRNKEMSGLQGSFSRTSKPGMAYLVNLTARAERDLAQLYREIDAEYSEAALKWYCGRKKAILTNARSYGTACTSNGPSCTVSPVAAFRHTIR